MTTLDSSLQEAAYASPRAAIIIIGAEVLSGKVDDANGPFLLRALRARGVEVIEIRTIGDDVATIAQAIAQLSAICDHVLTTGGVGPTHDDVTFEGVAAGLALPLEYDGELKRQLEAYFGDRINDEILSMAKVPQGSQVDLGVGAAPVVWVKNVIVLPGVPALMRACFGRIAHRFQGAPFFSRALLLNTSESSIAAALNAVQTRFRNVAIGSYPEFEKTTHKVKVTIDGRDADAVQAAFDAVQNAVTPQAVVGMV